MRASVGESDGIEYLGRITLCAFLREKLENADRAPVAQMDRVHASGAWGREFESHRARHRLLVFVINNFKRYPYLVSNSSPTLGQDQSGIGS